MTGSIARWSNEVKQPQRWSQEVQETCSKAPGNPIQQRNGEHQRQLLYADEYAFGWVKRARVRHSTGGDTNTVAPSSTGKTPALGEDSMVRRDQGGTVASSRRSQGTDHRPWAASPAPTGITKQRQRYLPLHAGNVLESQQSLRKKAVAHPSSEQTKAANPKPTLAWVPECTRPQERMKYTASW